MFWDRRLRDIIKHLFVALLFSVGFLFKCFPVCAQDRINIYSLDQYCTSEVKDISPTVNRLLQTGDVYVPPGRWRLNSKIKLPKGRKITGAGINTILYAEKPLRMVEVTGDDNEINNINFQGSNITEKASFLVYKLRGTKKLLIENCLFEGATGGVFVEQLCDSIFIRGCTFSKMYPCKQRISSGYGIVFHHNDKKGERGTLGAVIERNVFQETVFRHSIYLQSSEDIVIRDNVFYGLNERKPTECEFQVEIRGCRNLLLEGNTSSGGYGFINGIESKIHGRGSDFMIRNNLFIDNQISDGKKGILNIKFHNVVVKDNIFLNYNTIAIYIASVNRPVIEGNKFESSASEHYSEIEIRGKKIDTLKIDNNIFLRGKKIKTAAVAVQSSRVIDLDIKGNMFNGGSTGIEIIESKMNYLTIENNYHNGGVCNYAGNTIWKSVRYKNNRATKHPDIKVTKDVMIEVIDNYDYIQ